ncbi:MAG: biotin/lipoate A/B protein ligase family protein [Nostocaceae cyanobacterium]|nr:biotin/lipoate A/B protein ligase family protein [Nostocaceae cyanobacterium]
MLNSQTWRLIPLLQTSGKIQMVIDSWLLQQHLLGNQPPTLRFYTWLPAAISLGYHQHKYPQHWENLTWKGDKIDLVRRPTGGRGVLHQGDLTYAVITSGIPGNRMQVYEKICQFLIQGWGKLGVELRYGNAGRGYIHNPNCFGTATSADLVTLNGCKLIGSAQLRRDGAILQHGSMRLQPDAELFSQVFGAESWTPVELPENLKIEQIISGLVTAARDCFEVELEPQPLSDDEWKDIYSQIS